MLTTNVSIKKAKTDETVPSKGIITGLKRDMATVKVFDCGCNMTVNIYHLIGKETPIQHDH